MLPDTTRARSTLPAVSFAPWTDLTDDNSWLFLQDQRHSRWQGEIQPDWEVSQNWSLSEDASTRTLAALKDQETCLTFKVRNLIAGWKLD